MIRRSYTFSCCLLCMALFLCGCPKKVPVTIIEKPTLVNPIAKILEVLSPAESLQSRVSVRVEMVRNGEQTHFPTVNGFVFYQKPDKLRIVGFSPFPFATSLFDALYLNGEFLLLIIPEKRAYAGEVSQFEDLIEKAGPIEVSTEKPEGSEIPNRIRIHVVDKQTRIDLRLKEISTNASLPADTFQWSVPEGVEVEPIAQLLKRQRLR